MQTQRILRGLKLCALLVTAMVVALAIVPGGERRAFATTTPPTFDEFSLGDTTEGTSVTINRPSGTVEGNLLVASVVTNNIETISPPTGWGLINQGQCAGNECTLGVWFKVAGASEPFSYTFSWAGNVVHRGIILRYSDFFPPQPVFPADPCFPPVPTTPPYPVHVCAAATGTSSSATAPSVTTTIHNTEVLRIAALGGFTVPWNPTCPPATNSIFFFGAFNAVGEQICHASQPSAGATGTGVFPLPESVGWRTVTIALRPVNTVGGIAELPEVAGAPLEAPDSSGSNTGLIAGIAATIAAGTLGLSGAAWYTRRRL